MVGVWALSVLSTENRAGPGPCAKYIAMSLIRFALGERCRVGGGGGREGNMHAKLMGERKGRRIFLHEVPSLLGSSLPFLLPPDVYDVIILSYGARVARHHHCRISQPFNKPREEETQLIEHPSAKTPSLPP